MATTKAAIPIQKGIQRFKDIVHAASAGLRSWTACAEDDRYPNILVLAVQLMQGSSQLVYTAGLPFHVISSYIGNDCKEISICDISIAAEQVDEWCDYDSFDVEGFVEIA
jgi:hypothetical protein